jgi:radical SAM-linked protein
LKIRAKYTKLGYLKYLSHLDLVRLFNRSFIRADIPVRYSEGFNPHPKLSLGNPLPLGIESICEYFDVDLTENIELNEFNSRLNEVLPIGIKIIESKEIDEFTPSISSTICISEYEISADLINPEELIDYSHEINRLLDSSDINIEKKKKKGKNKVTTKVNIRPFILKLSINSVYDGSIKLKSIVMTGEKGNVKPSELLEVINKNTNIKLDLDSMNARKIASYTSKFEE